MADGYAHQSLKFESGMVGTSASGDINVFEIDPADLAQLSSPDVGVAWIEVRCVFMTQAGGNSGAGRLLGFVRLEEGSLDGAIDGTPEIVGTSGKITDIEIIVDETPVNIEIHVTKSDTTEMYIYAWAEVRFAEAETGWF